MNEFQWYEDSPGKTPLRSFLDAPLRPQAWANILYLALSFPLGLTYFVVLVTVIATGGGMAITLVGIPMLVGAMYAWPYLAEADRLLTNGLLGSSIPPLRFSSPERAGAWAHIKSRLASPATWLSLLHLLLRFPQGVMALVALSVFLLAPLALVALPSYYWIGDGPMVVGDRHIDTLPLALLASAGGAALLVVGFHALNFCAFLSRRMTEVVLAVPTPPGPFPAPAAAAPHDVTADAAEPLAGEQPPPTPVGDAPAISVDVAMRLVTVGGEPVDLTRREFDLLALFAANPGRPFSRDELLDRVWKGDYDVTDRTIDTHVQRLRKKLGEQADAIQTVWGVGYRFRER
ncbi:MAG: winged helix-turn-helix domain-containing protein [Dehalococcoidia bacterium]|nr:winged helix-turn-helix domain-containing protein [Dehalococcoidia bacterium]